MEPIHVREALQAMGAQVADPVDDAAADTIERICTDTRQRVEGALFFALRGENADGHQYVAQAFEKGAVAAVVDRLVEGAGGVRWIVRDTLQALGDLARYYRDRFDIPVVAVTGSVGKTSTREMIACALRARLCVLASDRNFNNEIGVPQTLFRLDAAHQVAVVELGMRARNEIARLAEIARPTVGVITNIGMSHVERLGSREEVARAKAELLEALPADGTAILPADDGYFDLLHACARVGGRVCTFGIQNAADFRATDVTFAAEGEARFRVNGQPFALRTPGVHHIANALAACAVASLWDIPLAEVAAQLETFRAPSMRMEIVAAPGGITLLNDAYNAAPDSMRAALETLTLLAAGRRTVAILGDMRELGDFSAAAHRYVGEIVASQGIDLLVTVGHAAVEIGEVAAERLGPEQIRAFPDTESAVQSIGALIRQDDVVLVKGSRAMAMEKIARVLVER